MENARKFVIPLIQRFSVGPDPNNEITVGLDWKEVKKNPDDILNLCEKIAEEKGFRNRKNDYNKRSQNNCNIS